MTATTRCSRYGDCIALELRREFLNDYREGNDLVGFYILLLPCAIFTHVCIICTKVDMM